MNRLLVIIVAVFLVSLFLIPSKVSAMMHVGISSNKVQDSKTTLSDEEYEKLGEELMEAMTGENHQEMDGQMIEMMGEDFLRQMHIAMGKRSQNPGSFGAMPMLAPYIAGGNGLGMGMMGTSGYFGRAGLVGNWPLASSSQFSGIHALLMIITWVSFIAFLWAGARWFWKKAGKK